MRKHDETNNLLLDLLTERRFGNKQAKELSESMAMCDAVLRLGERTGLGDSWSSLPVNVFVVADGTVPYTAACLALFFHQNPLWRFFSIDPLMDFDASHINAAMMSNSSSSSSSSSGSSSSRFNVFSCKSEDFDLSFLHTNCQQQHDSSSSSSHLSATPSSPSSSISILIACHSHAPLQEFWDRLSCPYSHTHTHTHTPCNNNHRLAATLPCCGKTWSNLDCEPLLEYDDIEVFSAKRRIFLYSSKQG